MSDQKTVTTPPRMEYVDILREFAKRNKRIRHLRDKGITLQAIADEFGISRARVSKILQTNGEAK